MSNVVLVRYGAIQEVARFAHNSSEPIERGSAVVVQSHRGIELGALLEPIVPAAAKETSGQHTNGDAPPVKLDLPQVLRRASEEDQARQFELRAECERQFAIWTKRIADWHLQLELIDLEWTLDRAKLILYVLNERGPECTKLALAAAAAGLGIIEVQPVAADGLVQIESASSCGSGGCGCDPH
jgi:cell fate regulator YaaT (PSP1 superfamily)